MLREPSMRVRETAAEQIETRQTDWAYSRPVVILDLIWNFAFIVISVSVLVMSRNEDPKTPLRIWIVGYACQCLLHMVCVRLEYKQRYQQQRGGLRLEVSDGSGSNSGSERREYVELAGDRLQNDDDESRYDL